MNDSRMENMLSALNESQFNIAEPVHTMVGCFVGRRDQADIGCISSYSLVGVIACVEDDAAE